MSRPALTAPVRAELFKLLLAEVRKDQERLNKDYPAGSIRALNGLRDGTEVVYLQATLLMLAGAIFGANAEIELGAALAWDSGDGKGRLPYGETLWLRAAANRAEEHRAAVGSRQ